MSWTQSWWPTSAWAGPASPRTAAAKPLAMMVANPYFFMVLSSSCQFEPWRESRGSDVSGVGEDFLFPICLVKQPGQRFNSDGSN
jgi:hypothetical protein